MRKITVFLSVSLLILAFPFAALSGDKQQFCNNYVDKSVSQYNLGKQHNLAGIVPPVWSNVKNDHFMWCMMVSENLVNSETSKRQAYLDQHIQKQLPTSPSTAGPIKGNIGGVVAATPISIPRPIKPGRLNTTKAVVANIPAGRIEKAELVSLDGNIMHIRFQYSVNRAIAGEMYGGTFLYDANLQAINTGYKPTRPYSATQGSMDIYLVLPAEPFRAATLETFVLYSGKVLVKQYFKTPFVWDGTQGGIVKPSLIKNGQGLVQNAQVVIKPMPTMPSAPAMKQLNPQVKIIKPSGVPIGFDPGRGP